MSNGDEIKSVMGTPQRPEGGYDRQADPRGWLSPGHAAGAADLGVCELGDQFAADRDGLPHRVAGNRPRQRGSPGKPILSGLINEYNASRLAPPTTPGRQPNPVFEPDTRGQS